MCLSILGSKCSIAFLSHHLLQCLSDFTVYHSPCPMNFCSRVPYFCSLKFLSTFPFQDISFLILPLSGIPSLKYIHSSLIYFNSAQKVSFSKRHILTFQHTISIFPTHSNLPSSPYLPLSQSPCIHSIGEGGSPALGF